MKSILLSVISFLLVMNVCGKNDVDMRTYLKKVLGNLGKIESASYHEQSQSWQPGDTVAITNFHRFIKEYTNPSDSTIGASYVCLDAKDTTRFEFGYDGNVRMISYHEHKGIMIDDFTTRSLPFRLVAPPFFCYTRNIIGYALSTGDSITTEWKDLGEAYYFKLVIHEDRQVEFFGKAYYIPKPPFDLGDPTSIYELWISKADGLPYKMRREMSHQISATTCSDVVLNQLSIAGLNLYDYVPQDYEIRKYGEQKKVTQPAATDLIGQKAPDWMLKDMYEKPVALSEFKSKVLLVNLTGIGCGACHASIPFLNGLKGKFNAGEFEVVSIETWGREPHSLRTYADKNQINYSFLCGDEGIVKSYRTYGAAPLFFILDQDRVIRKVIRGYRMGRTDEEITDAIKALLLKNVFAVGGYSNRKSYRQARTSSGLPICFPMSSDNFTHSRHSWFMFILHCDSFMTMFDGLNPVSLVRFVPMPKEQRIFPWQYSWISSALSKSSALLNTIVLVVGSMPNSL